MTGNGDGNLQVFDTDTLGIFDNLASLYGYGAM